MSKDLPVVSITHEQARTAFALIYEIISQAFPEDAKYTATQLNVHPSTVEEMYDLVREAQNNE